jgi:myosin heavy subunit
MINRIYPWVLLATFVAVQNLICMERPPLKKAASDVVTILEQYNNKIESLEGQLQELQQASEQVGKLQEDLGRQQTELERLRVEKKASEERAREAEGQIARREEGSRGLEGHIRDLEKRLAGAVQESQAQGQAAQGYKAQLDEVERAHQDALQQAQARQELLTTELEVLKQGSARRAEETAQQQEAQAASAVEIARLQGQLDALQAENEAIKTELASATQEAGASAAKEESWIRKLASDKVLFQSRGRKLLALRKLVRGLASSIDIKEMPAECLRILDERNRTELEGIYATAANIPAGTSQAKIYQAFKQYVDLEVGEDDAKDSRIREEVARIEQRVKEARQKRIAPQAGSSASAQAPGQRTSPRRAAVTAAAAKRRQEGEKGKERTPEQPQ